MAGHFVFFFRTSTKSHSGGKWDCSLHHHTIYNDIIIHHKSIFPTISQNLPGPPLVCVGLIAEDMSHFGVFVLLLPRRHGEESRWCFDKGCCEVCMPGHRLVHARLIGGSPWNFYAGAILKISFTWTKVVCHLEWNGHALQFPCIRWKSCWSHEYRARWAAHPFSQCLDRDDHFFFHKRVGQAISLGPFSLSCALFWHSFSEKPRTINKEKRKRRKKQTELRTPPTVHDDRRLYTPESITVVMQV